MKVWTQSLFWEHLPTVRQSVTWTYYNANSAAVRLQYKNLETNQFIR